MARHCAFVAAAFVTAFTAGSARGGAQGPPVSATEIAQVDYDEARRLIAVGDYAGACPLFARSFVIDPQVGTLLNVAHCFESEGRYASAWTLWVEAAREAKARGQDDRAAFATDRAKQIEDKVRKVTLKVEPQRPGSAIGITLDRAPVDAARWAEGIPLDAGEHEVAAEGAGLRSWSGRFFVEPDQSTEVAIPELEVAAPERTAVAERASAPERVSSPLRPVAWTVGGLGLAALGVGAAFGIAGLVAEKASTQNRNCVRGACNATGMSDVSQAHEDAKAADVSYSIGAGLLVAAGALWLAARDKPAEPAKIARIVVAPAVERGSVSLVVDGAW